MKKEIDEGLYPDPKLAPPIGPDGQPMIPGSDGQMLGQVPMEPQVSADKDMKINAKAAEI
jgi:hypothetical protein